MISLIRGHATSIMLAVLGPVLLVGGCASPPPLSDFERSLYTDGPHKASIVIYRSEEERWLDRPIPARIYIDGSPFARLLGGEYVQIYLASGQHDIRVEYNRDCELTTPEAEQTVTMDHEHVTCLEIVPGFGGMTWIFCSPFQLVPVPMIGSAVELLLKEEGEALKHLGRPLDEETLTVRRITR